MGYYIKTVGIRKERKKRKEDISIFEGRFAKMLLYKMCFRKTGGKVKQLQKGDKLIVYCIKNAVKEFPSGGFIGIQQVMGRVDDDPSVFGKPWIYVVDIKPKIYSFEKIVKLDDVKRWQHKSEKLRNALKAKLRAIGGLLEIDKSDYKQFLGEFGQKIISMIQN